MSPVINNMEILSAYRWFEYSDDVKMRNLFLASLPSKLWALNQMKPWRLPCQEMQFDVVCSLGLCVLMAQPQWEETSRAMSLGQNLSQCIAFFSDDVLLWKRCQLTQAVCLWMHWNCGFHKNLGIRFEIVLLWNNMEADPKQLLMPF